MTDSSAADNTKPWYRSRTLWLNALGAVLLVIEQQLGLIKPFLGADTYAAFALAVMSINAVLRTITSMGLRL